MARKPVLVEAGFKSSLERKVANQLDAAGVDYDHECEWVHYTVPQREAKYLPDFTIRGNHILIEAKGRFGGGNPRFKQPTTDGAKERQKLILLKGQHPEREIRIVFERASTPIYKGSKTTYGKWATDHGFKWSDKGVVPAEWIKDLKKKSPKN